MHPDITLTEVYGRESGRELFEPPPLLPPPPPQQRRQQQERTPLGQRTNLSTATEPEIHPPVPQRPPHWQSMERGEVEVSPTEADSSDSENEDEVELLCREYMNTWDEAQRRTARNVTALQPISLGKRKRQEEACRSLYNERNRTGRTKKRRVLKRQSTRGKKASRIKPKRQNGSKKRKGVKTRYVQGKKKKKKMNKKSSQKQNKK